LPAYKIRILVVSSPAFSLVVGHLFRERPEFEIVGHINSPSQLAREASRLLPELVVANLKPVRTGICSAVLSLKHSSPLSKLILICPLTDLAQAGRRCGADACLGPENLVGRLLPTATALSRDRISDHRTRKGESI